MVHPTKAHSIKKVPEQNATDWGIMIEGISGILGAGKTLFLTYRAYANFVIGREIFSNFDLGFKYSGVSSLSDLNTMFNGYVAIDDAYQWLNSRNIRGNEQALEILARSRKRKLDIGLSFVRAKQIDINVRFNISRIWVPILIYDLRKVPIALIAKLYEFRGEEDDEFLMYGKKLGSIVIRGSLLKKVMSLYYTEQEIDKLEN